MLQPTSLPPPREAGAFSLGSWVLSGCLSSGRSEGQVALITDVLDKLIKSYTSLPTAGVHWGYEETKAFLAILSESPFSEKLRTCHQNSQVYRAIAERLCALGFLRTLEQCRYRFKNLLRSYRKAKSSHPPGTCPFYEELDSLMRARIAVRALGAVQESTRGHTEADSVEVWGEVAGGDAMRPKTPDTGKHGTSSLLFCS